MLNNEQLGPRQRIVEHPKALGHFTDRHKVVDKGLDEIRRRAREEVLDILFGVVRNAGMVWDWATLSAG